MNQIRQTSQGSAEPADALFIIFEGFSVETVIDNDFTVGERDWALTNIGGEDDLVFNLWLEKFEVEFFWKEWMYFDYLLLEKFVVSQQ